MEETMSAEPSTEAQITRRKSTISGSARTGPLSRRSTMIGGEGIRSRRETIAQAAAKYYAPHTEHLSTSHHHRNFARMLKTSGGEVPRVAVNSDELRRFSLVQVMINFVRLRFLSHRSAHF